MQEKYDELQRLGIHSITDLNKYLDAPPSDTINARVLPMHGSYIEPTRGWATRKTQTKSAVVIVLGPYKPSF